MNHGNSDRLDVHLVGSIPLPDAEAVFRTLAGALGPHLRRIPDGETGDRMRWIGFIARKLAVHPDFEVDPGKVTTLIHVDSFNDSSIDIMLYCFTTTTEWGEWMRVKEDLTFAIKAIVEGAGGGFAFPSTSLYVETLPFGTPEAFPVDQV